MSLFPGLATEEILVRAKSHYTPNYRQAPVVLIRGDGVYVWDRDGRRYIDMVAGIAVCALGHCHPRLVSAVSRQAHALIHVSNLYHNEPAVALMDMLVSRSFADAVYFGNSGAEANEAAIKLARRYRHKVKNQPERTEILAFNKSFHGRTMATVTLTGQPKYHDGFSPLLEGVHYADFDDLESVRTVLAGADGRISTMIVEPIQCEGGLNIPSDGFLRGLRDICNEQDIVLIFDEVQTGIGRTGKLFAYQHSGVEPDIMTLAKGLGGGVPIGAMVAKTDIAQGFEPGSHASTFGGNPLATRAALEVLRVIEDEKLLDNAFDIGNYLSGKLAGLVRKYPGLCVEARGVGLLRGLELKGDLAVTVVSAAMEKGVLLNAIGGKVLRFVPPLNIEKSQINFVIGVLKDILSGLE
jgi:acetylornithine/N-succinyldiaminopimelate aminotransferase